MMENQAYSNQQQGYYPEDQYYNQQYSDPQYAGHYDGQNGDYYGDGQYDQYGRQYSSGGQPHYAPNPNYNRQSSYGGTSYGGSRVGSKHSLVSGGRDTTKSMMSVRSTRSVQSEYRDHKAQGKINSWYFGDGKKYMHIAIGLIILGLVFLLVFGIIMGLWRHARLHFSERVEFVPYLFLILAILAFGGSVHFIWLARKNSTRSRKNVAYKADGVNTVTVVDKKQANVRSQDNLKSGTYSHKAVGSTPNTTLNSIALSMDRSYMNRTMDRSTTKSLPSLDRSYTGEGEDDADSRRGDVF